MSTNDPPADLFNVEARQYWATELPPKLREIAHEFAARGLPLSSMRADQIVDVLLADLRRLTARRLALERELVEAAGSSLSAQRVSTVNAEIANFVNDFGQQVTARIREICERPGGPRDREAYLFEVLHGEMKWAKELATAQLNMLAQKSKAQAERQAAVAVYQFMGGIVQTGAGSAATQTISMSSDTLQVLRRDLAELRAILSQALAKGDERGQEVASIVEEAEAELVKAKPNFLKVKALIAGLFTGVQVLGSIEPAYKILKGIATAFGVQLP